MENKIINLESNDRFAGKRVKYNNAHAKINQGGHFENARSDSMTNEYQALEQKVDLLMRQIDEKITNQEKLTDAKFDLMVSKMETFQASVMGEIKSSNKDIKGEVSTLKSDINTVKAEMTNEIQSQINQSKKDTKTLVWTATGVIATVATLVVTILIPILTK